MTRHRGQPAAALRIAEFGYGTGRITDALAGYAGELVLTDYSATMVATAARRFPDARTFQADTHDAVTTLLGEGRAGSFDLAALHDAEDHGLGALTHARLRGVAYAPDRAAGRGWFFGEHFKHHPQLMNVPALPATVDAFLNRHRLPDDGSAIPSGVHIIDFHAGRHPFTALPRERS